MSIIDTWKAYVKAQEALTSQYSEPFNIKAVNDSDTDPTRFEIEQLDPVNVIYPELKRVFRGIKKEDIKIEKGYFLHDAEQPVGKTAYLKEFAEANYFEFSPKPCFSGEVEFNEPPFSWVEEFTKMSPNANGEILATFREIKAIDDALLQRPNFSRERSIGAVFKASPSEKYVAKQAQRVIDYLKNELGIRKIATSGSFNNILVENIFLKTPTINRIKELSAYHQAHHSVKFIVDEDVFSEFQKSRKERNIIFNSEDDSSIQKATILPTPEGNEFRLSFRGNITLSDLQFEIIRFKRILEKYFDKSAYKIEHQHILHLDFTIFFEHLSDVLSSEIFNVSHSSETVAFDFSTDEEFNDFLLQLENTQIVDFDYLMEKHRFKVSLQYDSPLLKIKQELASIPSVTSNIALNQQMLTFYCSFDSQELRQLLQNRVTDILQKTLSENAIFRFHEILDGRLKYFLSFNKSTYQSDIRNKFEYLLKEAVSLLNESRGELLGHIVKVNFPNLDIQLENDLSPHYLTGEWLKVRCELRGERDKIKRLSDTVSLIFSRQEPDIPNTRLRHLLSNSSKAETYAGDILLTQKYFEVKENVASNLLSSDINAKQLEGICKSLLADDLFMIQGPPGTGKSTAISELIWQHIREKRKIINDEFRVLVTSETNLAVDNALEKLKSGNHMLIKPIRFGSEDKLDKEGKQYSLEYLSRWANDNIVITDDVQAPVNILDEWINQIEKRSLRLETEKNKEVLKRWHRHLSKKPIGLRSIFYDNYLANANVIGATCSSIGQFNHKQHFTRFFRDYCQIFHKEDYDRFSKSPSKHTAALLYHKKIKFDLVVQDEASKASPPELALPCLYGKKSIIIGDHRQLPPMVDTNEFIENLTLLEARSKDSEYKNELQKLLQYVRNHRKEFEVSHFENLFFNIPENLRTSFNTQYRMHPGINETVKQFYLDDGGLKCGIPEDIANLKDLSHPLSRYHGVTKTNNTHVVWIDVQSPEIRKGTSRYNPGEVEKIDWLLDKIQQYSGYKKFVDFWPNDAVDEKQIGVITFYGAQAGELSKLQNKYDALSLRISPVDRFQGMERNIVIVSLVRSNRIAQFPNQPPNYMDFPDYGYQKQESLGFAELPNRLNVALSRAKRLLVIVGNSEHFRRNPIYDQVFKTIQGSPYGRIVK